MANIKSAIKRVGVNQKKRVENTNFKTEMRTRIKDLEKLIEAKETDKAKAALPVTFQKSTKPYKKAASTKITATGKKSRLAKMVNELGA